MSDITINSTRRTPQIEFKSNGELKIEGRSFGEDPRAFFEPLFIWVQQLEVSTVNMDIKMDYMNTSSTKIMNEFMKIFDANTKITKKVVNWYYEEEDEDTLEAGQIFEENTLTSEFFFRELVAV